MPSIQRDPSIHQPDGLAYQGPGPLPPIASYGDAAPTAQPLAPRARLKQAIAVVGAAKATREAAEGLNDKAIAMVQAAKDEYQKSQSVQHDVRSFKISAFRKGSSEPLPPDLIEARRESQFASEEYEHAQGVGAQMAQELVAASAAFEAAERVRSESASDVVLQEMNSIANELETLYQRRRHLREILRGAAEMPWTAQQRGVMQSVLNNSLNDPMLTGLAYPPVLPAAKAYWADFRSTLLADPDAKLGAPPDKL